MWRTPEANDHSHTTTIKRRQDQELQLSQDGCEQKRKLATERDIMGEVSKTHETIQMLDKTISSLEFELVASRAAQDKNLGGLPALENPSGEASGEKPKVFVVIGINTAFSSRKRRDSVRETWMPRGTKLSQLEQEKGIVIRFVIGRSATPGGILDRAIEAEGAQHRFLDD